MQAQAGARSAGDLTKLAAAAVLLAALLGSCGYVGDPKPPSLGIPATPTSLTVHQLGDHLIGEFEYSGLTTDDVPLARPDAAVRVGNREIPVPVKPDEPVRFSIASAEWTGQTVNVAAHLRGPRGRWSGWTNEVKLTVSAPVAPPGELTAEVAPKGVALSWTPPTAAILFRRPVNAQGAGDGDFAMLAEAMKPPFTDESVEIGKRYEYQVQARVADALSEPSATTKILFEDKFPPAVPSGLDAVAGLTSIELSWDLNEDGDFAGFLVYRATGSGGFARLAGPLTLASFSDRTVEPGVTYRYAVTSTDRNGNESGRSAVVEVMAAER